MQACNCLYIFFYYYGMSYCDVEALSTFSAATRHGLSKLQLGGLDQMGVGVWGASRVITGVLLA